MPPSACGGPFGKFSAQEFDQVVSVNLKAPFLVSQEVIPIMKANGAGRIINIASQMGSIAEQDLALYGLTKAALIYLTMSMAYELAPANIMVNAVSPGPTMTEYNVERTRQHPDYLAQQARIPSKRALLPPRRDCRGSAVPRDHKREQYSRAQSGGRRRLRHSLTFAAARFSYMASGMGETGTILITGAAGFLGSALGQRLIDAGERVVGLDVAPAGKTTFPCVTSDVRDADAIYELCGCLGSTGPLVPVKR